MKTTTLVENGAPVLWLEGRLGRAQAAELEAAARQLLRQGASDLAIDLSGVDYLSSAALKAIEALAADRFQLGSRVTLRAPSVPARHVLELAGLLKLVGL